MAYIKPGSVVGGYVWTGKRWVRKPERQADKVKIQKEVDQYSKNTEGPGAGARRVRESQMRTAKASYPGGVARMAAGGSSKASSLKGGMRPVGKDKPKADKTPTQTPAQRPAVSPAAAASKTTKPASAPSGAAKKVAAPKKTVSQSNTMWVKKGDTVGGKTVQKGYLAQYGKPEKKVTANVKLVVDTSKGKAGQKVSYAKGRVAKGKGK